MMTLLRFGQVDEPQLAVEIREPDLIQRGAGLHRLRFPMQFDSRTTLPAGIPLEVTAQVWLADNNDWLGFAQSDRPIITNALPFNGELILALSDEQLAVLEDRRAGNDLHLRVTFDVTLGYRPIDGSELWPSRPGEQSLWIQSGPWQRLLLQSSSGISLAIVVPVPLGSDSAAVRAGGYLREAIGKVNAGEFVDAVVAARKAIDSFDTADSKWESEKTIVGTTKPEERTLLQRRTMLRHALKSLASPAAHADENARGINWDRAGTMSVIAAVAAFVAVT